MAQCLWMHRQNSVCVSTLSLPTHGVQLSVLLNAFSLSLCICLSHVQLDSLQLFQHHHLAISQCLHHAYLSLCSMV